MEDKRMVTISIGLYYLNQIIKIWTLVSGEIGKYRFWISNTKTEASGNTGSISYLHESYSLE